MLMGTWWGEDLRTQSLCSCEFEWFGSASHSHRGCVSSSGEAVVGSTAAEATKHQSAG